MSSVKDKFLQTLSLSDEGIEMMLQRIRRENPGLDKESVHDLFRKEVSDLKSKKLPKYLSALY